MGPLAALCLSLLVPGTQDVTAPVAPAAIVSGALEGGQISPRALIVGDGGLGSSVVTGGVPVEGQYLSPGGVLVRARREGVKLDFPSGVELLIGPDGAVHLRGGEHTPPAQFAAEVWLVDGTRVRATREPGRHRPLREVSVVQSGETRVLWRGERVRSGRARSTSDVGQCYVAAAHGDVLYLVAPLGPLFALERVLCPRPLRSAYPLHRLVIAGDILVDSLRRLPGHLPAHAVQYPEAPEAARNLAQSAQALFPSGAVVRPPSAVGALVFGLVGDFRLVVEERDREQFWLALYRGSVTVPAVEWHVGSRFTLHVVRPDGGSRGGPRHFMRGLETTDAVRALWPVRPSLALQARARKILRALGARQPAAAWMNHHPSGVPN